ncbi:TRAP transporter large permease [Pseudochelatococcus sp. B33]
MSDIVFNSIFLFAAMLILLCSGMWIFLVLTALGALGLWWVTGFPINRIGLLLQTTFWNSSKMWELSAVPLFVWMGEIYYRTNLAAELFRGIAPWIRWLPGRLLHSNVIGCTAFAAVSGSSAATTATIARITLPVLATKGYSRNLALGSLAGAGTLGILIPPSTALIIYGVLAEVSIADLFVAGIVPGLMVAGLSSLFIMIVALIKPSVEGTVGPEEDEDDRPSVLSSLSDILPTATVFAVVMGTIYLGVATPSESAAIGLMMTGGIVTLKRRFSIRVLAEALASAVRTSCMVCILLVSAAFLTSAMSFMHLPTQIAEAIGQMNLPPLQLILILAIFYLLLGIIVDGLPIMVMTLPFVYPLVTAAGYDPIWLGIFIILNIEMGMVSPPVGLNLFVIKGLTGESIGRIGYAALPFFAVMCVVTALISVFPDLVLWLPSLALN